MFEVPSYQAEPLISNHNLLKYFPHRDQPGGCASSGQHF